MMPINIMLQMPLGILRLPNKSDDMEREKEIDNKMVLKQLEHLITIMKDLAFVTRDCILLLNKKTEFSNERISRLENEINELIYNLDDEEN
jgi:hypothetical protein